MSEHVALRNARYVDPASGSDRICDLDIVEGCVSQSGVGPFSDTLEVDCTGVVVASAFIDLHCHLREPGYEYKETIRSGTAAAAAGGFTTVCCMPNTSPPLDNGTRLGDLRGRVSRDAFVRVLPLAAVTVGQSGLELVDVDDVVRAGAVGLSDDGRYVTDSVVMRNALIRANVHGIPVVDHAQDDGLVAGGVMHEGEVSKLLGLAGMPTEAEELAIARDIALARLTGAHIHIAHVTTWRGVDLIRRAKLESLNVTAEVTPHHLTLTERDVVSRQPDGEVSFDNGAKVNPPLRTAEDVSALASGLCDGTIDAIATDHAPHSPADKGGTPQEAAFGIAGFETALGAVLELYHRGFISLARLLRALTSGPAAVLGDKLPVAQRDGQRVSDLVLFDPGCEWTVEPDSLLSHGANTPFVGRTLQGKVLATFCNGVCVFASNEFARRIVGQSPSWWTADAGRRASRETVAIQRSRDK